ncbi:MAG TPA: GNAT family N-acetyltransferase [Streptosporangiaceae bacterium]
MGYEVRRVRPDDWATLREVRLAALADAPYAFASTLENESGQDEQRWRERIGRDTYFLGWDGGRPAGLAGTFRQQDGDWHLISMWVSPQARGTGLADELVDVVVRHVRGQGAANLLLWVADGNDRARDFYLRVGFRSTGRRQPIRPQAPELGEEQMSRSLAAERQSTS